MRKNKLTIVVLNLAVMLAPLTLVAEQQPQTAPRKYIIKPLNLGTNTEIRARSTRNLQVQVTDENDRPVPDAALLLLLLGGGSGNASAAAVAGQAGNLAGQTASSVTGTVAGQASSAAGTLAGQASSAAGTVAGQTTSSAAGTLAGQASSNVAGAVAGQASTNSAGTFAGQTSLRALTNAQGVANVEFTGSDSIGSSMRLQIRVEGSDAMWQGTLTVVRAAVAIESSQSTAPISNAAALSTMDAEENACLALINKTRAENKQPPVRVSVKLTDAAKWLSNDNATNKPDDPDHTDSLGRDVGKRLRDFGYEADIIKENIVVGAESATYAMQVWLGSGFHVRNILSGYVRVVGVSRVCKKGAKSGCHWTVILGSTED